MDSFELNKIIGAILGTLLFVMGVGFLAEAIYSPIEGRGPGYELPEPEGTVTAEAEEPAAPVDIGTLLASANADQGKASAGRCGGCHHFEQGAGNKQGPELFGVVGRPIASHEGYNYDEALMAHADDVWSYENLNAFLTDPDEFAPGTKMNFGGLKDDAERANVIAYLASVSPDAPPFPEPAPAAAPAEDEQAAAPAEGEAAATNDQAAPPAASGEAPAPADQAAVPTEGDAVATPTETGAETSVQGTPTTSGPEGTPPASGGEVVPEVPVAQ